MKFIIDRFEGEFVILASQDKQKFTIPKACLPNLITEGDVIKIEIDEEATAKRQKHLQALMNELWQ